MNDAMLRLREVNLFRSQRRVLAGVTFDVARGELVALMGPSGVGKTTVLRLIGGQQKATGGAVLFDGKDVGKLRMFASEKELLCATIVELIKKHTARWFTIAPSTSRFLVVSFE